MANELFIYPNPKSAHVQVRLDTGAVVPATGPINAYGRDDAHVMQLPDGTVSQGCVLEISEEGYYDFANRGLLIPASAADTQARFMLDDVDLIPIATTPDPGPEPPQPPANDPESIINDVYATGKFNLATHDGCGEFTEECCKQLHSRNSTMWGHIKKNPGQNQYNGHAVDALMLLTGSGHGTYDIIYDSVSPNARPAYNRVGDADPDLWYYDEPTDERDPDRSFVLIARRRGEKGKR